MMKKPGAMLAIAALCAALPAQAQENAKVRPEKEIFRDAQGWPATQPGEVKLKNFRPFRAVYQRAYLQGSGPNRGDLRVDRVIISAERVGWEGKEAILVTLIDSGQAKWADTAARSLFSIVDARDMSVFFESGPIPGKAKDYYLIRPDKGLGSLVTTENAAVQKQEFPAGAVGFGPGPWVMASMNLEEGMKVRLDRFVSPTSTVFGYRSGIVRGKRDFTDLSGQKRKAWLLEQGGNLASPRMGRIYLIDEPPYLLARFSVDGETKKETQGIRLLSFQYLN